MVQRKRAVWGALTIVIGAFMGVGTKPHTAAAGPATDPGGAARCANRLKTAFAGTGATAAEREAADPQATVDALMRTPQFVERFARFLNAEFNTGPGVFAEDAAYYLGKHVLENDLPYRELFVGKFKVEPATAAAPQDVRVTASPDGLGYFRSRPWMMRYAGNELNGVKLVTAYRIMQNVVGLKLTATQNAEGVDLTAEGRRNGACAKCHYDGWSALDKVASVLTVRNGVGAAMKFDPPRAASTEIGGAPVTDDATLVLRLVESENFAFNACRLSFKFLYAREENTCESVLFDACIDAFKATGKIQSALAAVAKNSNFCQ